MEGQFLSLRQAYISDMSILLGLEPFKKLAVVGGGGLKAFQSSALVQTLDLGLEAWTKLNNSSPAKLVCWCKFCKWLVLNVVLIFDLAKIKQFCGQYVSFRMEISMNYVPQASHFSKIQISYMEYRIIGHPQATHTRNNTHMD